MHLRILEQRVENRHKLRPFKIAAQDHAITTPTGKLYNAARHGRFAEMKCGFRHGCFRTQLDQTNLWPHKPTYISALRTVFKRCPQQINGRAGEHSHPMATLALDAIGIRRG